MRERGSDGVWGMEVPGGWEAQGVDRDDTVNTLSSSLDWNFTHGWSSGGYGSWLILSFFQHKPSSLTRYWEPKPGSHNNNN